MIVAKGQKVRVLYFFNDKQVHRMYKGDNMIYNCYVIPKDNQLTLFADGSAATTDVKSNTFFQIY